MKEKPVKILVDSLGLTSDDASYIVSEVKCWIKKGEERKKTKSIQTQNQFIIVRSKEGILELALCENGNVIGASFIEPNANVQIVKIPESDF